jgi:TonB family protein
MKSVVALATIVAALSLCNLLGRRSNQNANANRRESGTTQETSNQAPAPEQAAPPVESMPPSAPQSRNQNSAVNVPRAPISGGVLNGKAVKLVQPSYPAIARAAHASGAVNVQIIIDESGSVTSAHAVSGHPLLRASAEAAAREARFLPTKLSGQPVKVTGIIVYNFVAR